MSQQDEPSPAETQPHAPQAPESDRPDQQPAPSPRGPFERLMHDINHAVFWPPFLLLLAAVALNMVAPESFMALISGTRGWLLVNFGWLFTLCAISSVMLCLWICFSNFGNVRLGGKHAKPLMHMWNWFSITVCTTIAVGILFWATAEPIFHYHAPPAGKGIEAATPAAASFAMSTMYLHWTFTPYAIYCVGSLMFAFAYYNMKQPFSIASMLVPLTGANQKKSLCNLVDAVCLYALVAGMAASLGTGILTISGGLDQLGFTERLGLPRGQALWAIITAAIVVTFVISSATGLMKGIRILSDVNTKALFGLAIVALVCGPTAFILDFGIESFGIYLTHFFEMNLFNGTVAHAPNSETTQWSHSWTVFYWAVWLAWAPVTACFLGRIAYGRTVREFMLVNFVFPALFGATWMAIFSGTALHMEMHGANLVERISGSTEAASYAVFETFPFSFAVILFYLVSAFICFVTSADSNTSAMASISSTGISPDNPEGNLWIKIIWGVLVGTVAWVMISFADVEGIRIISSLGGFPAAVLIVFVIYSLAKVVGNHEVYNLIDREEA